MRTALLLTSVDKHKLCRLGSVCVFVLVTLKGGLVNASVALKKQSKKVDVL